MRIVIQRVKKAQVKVQDKVVGKIDKGALVLFGVKKDDDISKVPYLCQKLVNLRMFSDENHKMNLSLKDIDGEVLIVSQFTLYADCTQGRRPSFTEAAVPQEAEAFYEKYILEVKKYISKVETGVFGAMMQVELINDGPVTFLIES